MSSATGILRDEHRVILHGLRSLEVAAERLGAGQALPPGLWDEMLGWFRAFADRMHHAKEENLLFPAMIKAGVPPRGGPIDVMLDEHAEGRALLAAMATGTGAERAARARRYVRLLCDHIDKENGLLFPLADAVLDARGDAELRRELATVEAELGDAASLSAAEAAAARFAAALEASSGG
ncbi:MAG TPA: hemerythrin domain-containing protein [Methylomirabilota bacterium]|nr:hemerythrin domain-containing protein [Methylomirabilota bacterium]